MYLISIQDARLLRKHVSPKKKSPLEAEHSEANTSSGWV